MSKKKAPAPKPFLPMRELRRSLEDFGDVTCDDDADDDDESKGIHLEELTGASRKYGWIYVLEAPVTVYFTNLDGTLHRTSYKVMKVGKAGGPEATAISLSKYKALGLGRVETFMNAWGFASSEKALSNRVEGLEDSEGCSCWLPDPSLDAPRWNEFMRKRTRSLPFVCLCLLRVDNKGQYEEMQRRRDDLRGDELYVRELLSDRCISPRVMKKLLYNEFGSTEYVLVSKPKRDKLRELHAKWLEDGENKRLTLGAVTQALLAVKTATTLQNVTVTFMVQEHRGPRDIKSPEWPDDVVGREVTKLDSFLGDQAPVAEADKTVWRFNKYKRTPHKETEQQTLAVRVPARAS